MARHKESASESESKSTTTTTTTTAHPPNASSKTSQKAKNQAAQQAQQLYLQRHINKNGVNDKPKVKPLDFDLFDDEVLVRYNTLYNLGLGNPVTVNNDMLNSEIGKKTFSKRSHTGGVTKPELASQLKGHFLSLPCKENEIVTNFLYKVKHQGNDFKLTFK